MSNWFSAHTHSNFSALDGMVEVPRLIDKAVKLDYPGLAMTDHGNMAATVQLYKGCKEAGILPFPGVELYLLDPEFDGDLKDSGKAGRYHVIISALTERGVKGLTKLTTLTHTRPRFSRFPRATLADLRDFGQEYGNDVALLTGCFFGLAQQYLVNRGPLEATNVIKMYASMFPHTFVELQNHNIAHSEDPGSPITHDKHIVKQLEHIADKLGLPVLATQDSHYCDQREKTSHALMKRMVYGGKEDEFPGDSFHLASGEWVESHYDPSTWAKVEDAAGHLLGLNKVKIPPLDKFTAHVPTIKKAPIKFLRRECEAFLHAYIESEDITGKHEKDLWARLDYELDGKGPAQGVIAKLGMGNYFVMVQDIVQYCKRKSIMVEARGSANGSLVCFALGITQVDSVYWDLLFDRFLSLDRIKPPDVDLDVEDAYREDVVQYVSTRYPGVDTVKIGTWGKLGAREDDDKGSVLVSYMSSMRRQCVAEGVEWASENGETKGSGEEYGKQLFKERYGHIQGLRDVKEVSYNDWVGLKQMANMDSVYRSYGVHAAGVLMSSDAVPIKDWIPTMLVASSDTHVTQYDMDDVEQFGNLKMDFLGQITLTVMKRCQELMGQDDPTDLSWIPMDDPEACKLLREGRPDNGIFHFEGYTKSKGGKELGIKSVRDTILAQGLYMPGAMDTGQKDLYLHRKRNREARNSVTYLHPAFEKALSWTYGTVIFQEQVINIMRGLGMSIEGVNKFFKVVKDSGKGAVARNVQRMKEVQREFNQLCEAAGIDDVEAAWEQTAGFVAYGFNRAHATGYGIRAYRCAYLKAHYPLEFMTALLQCWSTKNKDKEKLYGREARRMGLRLLPADVNISSMTWTIDETRKDVIRKGLVSIQGIGPACATELAKHAPYDSIRDIVKRCNGRSVTGGNVWIKEKRLIGTLKTLKDAGALDDVLDRMTRAAPPKKKAIQGPAKRAVKTRLR